MWFRGRHTRARSHAGLVPLVQAETAAGFANVTFVDLVDSGHFAQEDVPGDPVAGLDEFYRTLGI